MYKTGLVEGQAGEIRQLRTAQVCYGSATAQPQRAPAAHAWQLAPYLPPLAVDIC